MKPSRYALALVALLSTPPALGRDDDDDGAAPVPSPAVAPSVGGVRLDAERQRRAGLVVAALKPARFQPEADAYGKVLDIQPLLELRVRERAARAEAEVAAAAHTLARKNRDRLAALHRADIVAGRELVQAEAQWQEGRAKEDAARRLLAEIHREARQAWGGALARLALDGDAPLFDDFLNHRRALLLVVLPTGYAPGAGPLAVGRDRDRARATPAAPLSPATRTDELVQGETWFYHTSNPHLRSGMRVNAWVPLGGGQRDGVDIPPGAVVWQAGKPWVYRRAGAEGFVRVEVADYRDHAGGWFVERGLAPGEEIVVTGGQVLLSEEFRQQIPDEDDD